MRLLGTNHSFFKQQYNCARLNQSSFQTRSETGFSIIELMISVCILGILSGIAVPSMSNFINKISLQSSLVQLSESLMHARNHAINYATTVQVCQLSEESEIACSQNRQSKAPWSSGWLSFVDLNGNNDYDSNDLLLRISKNDSSVNVVFNQRGRLRFFANGSARSAGFYLCDTSAKHHRHIRLLHTGRIRSEETQSAQHREICRASSANKLT